MAVNSLAPLINFHKAVAMSKRFWMWSMVKCLKTKSHSSFLAWKLTNYKVCQGQSEGKCGKDWKFISLRYNDIGFVLISRA